MLTIKINDTEYRPQSLPRSILIFLIICTVFLSVIALCGGIMYGRHLFAILDASAQRNAAIAELANSNASQLSFPQLLHQQPKEQPPEPETPVTASEFIDLQSTVDDWLKTTNRQIGLMIYDLDHGRTAASFQPNKIFNIASIYKLFFVYDGYRQITLGLQDPNDIYITTSDYRADDYTFSECLDLMIRESYNGCADPMRSNSNSFKRVEKLIAELGLKNTEEAGLYSTAADVTELLKLYWQHPDLSDATWQAIADSMLNQPPTTVAPETTYDWRQGLPAGFSKTTKVYDKVGWNWNGHRWDTYADAAIVEFPQQNRHYIVVVITEDLDSEKTITNLATRLEAVILNN